MNRPLLPLMLLLVVTACGKKSSGSSDGPAPQATPPAESHNEEADKKTEDKKTEDQTPKLASRQEAAASIEKDCVEETGALDAKIKQSFCSCQGTTLVEAMVKKCGGEGEKVNLCDLSDDESQAATSSCDSLLISTNPVTPVVSVIDSNLVGNWSSAVHKISVKADGTGTEDYLSAFVARAKREIKLQTKDVPAGFVDKTITKIVLMGASSASEFWEPVGTVVRCRYEYKASKLTLDRCTTRRNGTLFNYSDETFSLVSAPTASQPGSSQIGNYLEAIKSSDYTTSDPFNCGYRVSASTFSKTITISVRSLRGTGSCTNEGKNLGTYTCSNEENKCIPKTSGASFSSLSICTNGNIQTNKDMIYVGGFNPVSQSCTLAQ